MKTTIDSLALQLEKMKAERKEIERNFQESISIFDRNKSLEKEL